MKKILIIIICFSFLTLISACNGIDITHDEFNADDIVNKMTTEEKVTQMIMIADRTYEKEDGTKVNLTEISADLEALINRYAFGGMILFGQNCAGNTQTYKLIHELQLANANHNSKLLIAVDQEGGRVVRLEEGTQFSGNMALGAVNDLNDTTRVATLMGKELNILGFNTNFAPVVDVNNNPTNPVIGTRSFSDDPNIVSEQATAFMKGLKSSNIISTLKHFPGHGDTSTDSHTGLPLINKTYEELKQNELIPYAELINNGVDMIMTAHIQYSQIEKQKYISKLTGEEIMLPATLSKTIITDILRGDYGFEGVVITDAMEMDAIAKHFDRYDACKLAIEAGVDILLMPTDLGTKAGFKDIEEYIATVVSMVDKGEINIEKINEANKRIINLKHKYGLLDKYSKSNNEYNSGYNQALNEVGSKANHELELEIASKAITLIKNDNCLPLSTSKLTSVVTIDTSDYLGVDFGKALSVKKNINFDYNKTCLANNSIDQLKESIKDSEQIIIFSQMGNASFLKGTNYSKIKELIKYAKESDKKVVILSTNLPYDIALYDLADAIVVAYSPKVTTVIPTTYQPPVKQFGPNIPTAISKMFDPLAVYSGTLPINVYAIDDELNYDLNNIRYERGYGLTK